MMEEEMNNENGFDSCQTNPQPAEEAPTFISKETMTPVEEPVACEKKRCCCKTFFCKYGSWLCLGVLFIAVIVLYILHFCCGNKAAEHEAFVATPCSDKPGTGEVLYVDVDSINSAYLLMDQLQKELEAEQQKQQTAFEGRQNSFQQKYSQFEKNYNAGILTETQIQNTSAQLQQESQQLEALRQQIINDLTDRQYAANTRMLDSVKNVAARINKKRNASYILTYQKDVPFMIYQDKTKDITEEVLFELNKPFKNKKEE